MSTVYTALFFVRGKHQNTIIIVNIYHRPISQLVYHKAPFLRPQGRGIQVYQQNLKKINRNNGTATNTPMITPYRKTLPSLFLLLKESGGMKSITIAKSQHLLVAFSPICHGLIFLEEKEKINF